MAGLADVPGDCPAHHTQAEEGDIARFAHG